MKKEQLETKQDFVHTHTLPYTLTLTHTPVTYTHSHTELENKVGSTSVHFRREGISWSLLHLENLQQSLINHR